MTYMDLIQRNHERYRTYERSFHRIFGIPLRHYWDKFYGFEIFKFDDFLEVPEDVSMEEYIESIYGQEAVELIKKLIEREETKEEE